MANPKKKANGKTHSLMDRVSLSISARMMTNRRPKVGPRESHERRRRTEGDMNEYQGLEALERGYTVDLIKDNQQLREEIAQHAQVEESLRQRVAELEAHNEQLEAFARSVAHSLHAPLSVAIGYAEFLQQEYGALPDDQVRDHLHTIEQNGRQVSQMLDDLLLLAGVRGKSVEPAPLDMAGIVADAQRRLAPMIDEYQAEITSPQTWPVALGYAPWIEEVWVNYLSNAIKYGGRPPRLELGATLSEQADDMIRFWVRDNGPGLTSEEQAQLFKPFTRLHPDRAQGHGLGLSIVRCMVETLGGQVGVESEENAGSAFTFTLPSAAGG